MLYADLNTFLSTLDKRYEKKVSREGGTVARKARITGAPSTSSPPDGAPQWTVSSTALNLQVCVV